MSTPKQRVVIFIGTRPECIKLAPVVHALEASRTLEPVVVSTGQHREMLSQFVALFRLRVHRDLGVMTPDQRLAGLTARLLEEVDRCLGELDPSFALVQGDTTTVLAASLACFYRGIPIGHVEAGLRSGNLHAPFPEEANRVIADRLSTLHFAPTERARRSLIREGLSEERVLVSGNTVIDALQMEVNRQRDPAVDQQVRHAIASHIGEGWDRRAFVLVTGHRRENFGRGFEEICEALAELARRFPDVSFVYPVHLNPNVQRPVRERLGSHGNICLMPPVPYPEFVSLLRHCRLVLTDSGGVQEEAPGLGKPVLVMRDTTERPEGVEAGIVRLVGARRDRIVSEVAALLTETDVYDRMARASNPYGDGKAGARIAAYLEEYLLGTDAGLSR